MFTKKTGAVLYGILYIFAFYCYFILIGVDIFRPVKQETFDLLGKFLFYAGGGFFAIIGLGTVSLFKK
jgi:hypothetical protein